MHNDDEPVFGDDQQREQGKQEPSADSGAEAPIVGRLVDEPDQSSPTSGDAEETLAELEGDDFGLTESKTSPVVTGAGPGEEIRVGSPFRIDPSPIAGTVIQRRRARPEDFYDVGPLRYTAMGAVAAATLVLGFAAAAAWWFPGGGTIIASLGCALSIFGLYSRKRLAAGVCLLLHLMLFMISYSRAIEV